MFYRVCVHTQEVFNDFQKKKKNLLSTVSFYPTSRQTIKEKSYLCKWNLREFIKQKNKEWGQVSIPGRLLSLQENKRTA